MPTIRTQLELIDNMSNRFAKIEAAARRSASAGEQLEAAYASSSSVQQMDYMESKLGLQERALEQQGAKVEMLKASYSSLAAAHNEEKNSLQSLIASLEQQGMKTDELKEKYEAVLNIHSADNKEIHKILQEISKAEMAELEFQQSANTTANAIDKQKLAALAVTQALEQSKAEQEATWSKAEIMSSEFANVVTDISSKLASMSDYAQGMDLDVFKATEIEKYSNELDKVQLDLLKVRNAETALSSAMSSNDINQVNQAMKNYDGNLIKLVTSNQGAVNATDRLKSAEWQRIEAYATAVSKAETMSSEFSSVITDISSKLESMSGYAQSMDLEIFKVSEMEKYSAQLDKVNLDLYKVKNAEIALKSAMSAGNINAVNQAMKSYDASMMRLVTSNQGAVNATDRLRAAEWQRVEALEQSKRAAEEAYAQGAYEKTKQQITQMQVKQKQVTSEIEASSASQKQFTDAINGSNSATSGLLSKLGQVVSIYAVIRGAKKLFSGTIGSAIDVQKQVSMMSAQFSNADVGEAYFDKLQKRAADTGMDINALTGTMRNFMSYTKNTDKLDKFLDISEKLAMKNPTQGVDGAAFAIQEAMSGQFTSLRNRFNLSSAQLEPLKNAIKTGNIDGIQEALGKVMDNAGITDEVVEAYRNSASNQINSIKTMFAQGFAGAGEKALESLQPVFEQIKAWLQSEEATQFFSTVSYGIELITNALIFAGQVGMQAAGWIKDNWGAISPILSGIVGALIALKFAVIAYNVVQTVLNLVLYACPLVWIVMAIGLVAGAIFGLSVKSVGLKATMLKVNDGIQTSWEFLAQGIQWCVMKIIVFWNKFLVTTNSIGYGITNFFQGIGVDILTIIQDCLNGAIGLINDFIGLINKIPGVAIKPIEPMTFAAKEAAKYEADKQARSSAADAYKAEKETENKVLEDKYDALVAKNKQKQAARDKEIENAVNEFKNRKVSKEDKPEKNRDSLLNDYNKNTVDSLGSIDNNTKKTQENTEKAEDDLKWLKDIAEQEQINRFTTATLAPQFKMEIGNINKVEDVDGIMDKFTNDFREMVAIAAEGV